MQTITLTRTGDRPLEFEGAEVASADTRQTQGPCENRWWNLALYRADSGKYVLHIGYRTQWQGEHATDTVYVADDAASAAELLHAHPYTAGIHGYPPGRDDRQARLEQMLRQCWEAGITELLADIEPERI